MDKKIIAYTILGILILSLTMVTLFPGMLHAFKDSDITGGSVKDKCAPGPGYTEEYWIEHMGHHPNLYKECLE